MTGVSRRAFLHGSGAMVVAFAAARHAGLDALLSAQGINGRSATALDAWIAITSDGRVQAYTGKCELGQGLHTAQVQLVAEELDVPLSRVSLTMCDTKPWYAWRPNVSLYRQPISPPATAGCSCEAIRRDA
jgi:nicotinate dehydrogenase subunit B